MSKKALTSCVLLTTVATCILFTFTTDRYYGYLKNAFAPVSVTSRAFTESHDTSRESSIFSSVSNTTKETPPVVSTTTEKTPSVVSTTTVVETPPVVSASSNFRTPIRPNLSFSYDEKLRALGLESTRLHNFKSPYIIDPVIYDKNTIYRVPGKRKVKIISCYNCPLYFEAPNPVNSRNRDFQKCPYSECYFDVVGDNLTQADVVLFFTQAHDIPFRPPGQIWAFCSWEPPLHFHYPEPYPQWKGLFNWTVNYEEDADIFMPYNFFAWRAKETLMDDSEYLRIAKSKTKTAAWFVSNCESQSKRQEYVKRMQKIIDIDVYGHCSDVQCEMAECLDKLNKTYKFYISFENSLCKDYVTEKLFRNFDKRMQVVPVARGSFDYQKHVPPGMIVDASQFKSPEALAEHLKELADDLLRYAAMLKEKDKLKVLNYKYDWCELCERLHKGVKPKIMEDIKIATGYTDVCVPPDL